MENSIFISYTDYNILDARIPVLARQENGKFKFTDCYFIEFFIKPGDETSRKINMICKPFIYKTAIKYIISKHDFLSDNALRLFLLVEPNAIKNNFHETDDLLAIALCLDGSQNTFIQYFEVNYKFRHSYEPNQKYRRVGTSAANALKKFYHASELCGESALDAIKFWLKNGFTRPDNHDLHLHLCHR